MSYIFLILNFFIYKKVDNICLLQMFPELIISTYVKYHPLPGFKESLSMLQLVLARVPLLRAYLPVLSKSISCEMYTDLDYFSMYHFFCQNNWFIWVPSTVTECRQFPADHQHGRFKSEEEKNAFMKEFSNHLAMGKQTCKVSKGVINHPLWVFMLWVW